MAELTNPVREKSWRDSPQWGMLLILIYITVAALPVVLASFLSWTSRTPMLIRLGRAAALTGTTLLVLQAVLSGRFKTLDRPFGLDMLINFHRYMAFLAGALLMVHPILLYSGADYGADWRVYLGMITLAMLVGVIFVAVARAALGIEYQLWRVLHKGVVLVVVAGFIHAFSIGYELTMLPFQVLFGALLALLLGIFLYRNIYVPLWGRRRFRVAAVRQTTHDVYTLELEPEDDRPMPHLPGQFMFMKLYREGRPSEEHPFTISSSPSREMPITASIKESGDYTDTIGQTQVGDRAAIEAPYGRFTFLHHEISRFVFIVGGIGITPIVSMLRYMHDTGDHRPAILLYGNKTEDDIAFREELEQLGEHVKVVHVLSQPSDEWDGLRGHVTREIIEDQAGELLADAHVWLCGPPPMMDQVLTHLRKLGVENGRIHFERFSL